MAKCQHKTGIILANASYVEFWPDQEPFTDGVVQASGFDLIQLESINIQWCPRCEEVVSIESTGESEGFES